MENKAKKFRIKHYIQVKLVLTHSFSVEKDPQFFNIRLSRPVLLFFLVSHNSPPPLPPPHVLPNQPIANPHKNLHINWNAFFMALSQCQCVIYRGFIHMHDVYNLYTKTIIFSLLIISRSSFILHLYFLRFFVILLLFGFVSFTSNSSKFHANLNIKCFQSFLFLLEI